MSMSEADKLKAYLRVRSAAPFYFGLDYQEASKVIPRIDKIVAEERAAAVAEYIKQNG